MSRASRLLDLIELLRRHRRPVQGAVLAEELGISIRTLYRDIATLQAQGADIEGEPGVGYVLKPGFLLPPLMLSVDEIEALSLGVRWVAAQTDERLASAAEGAIAKLAAVLPEDIAGILQTSGLFVPTRRPPLPAVIDLAQLRAAIRSEQKLVIDYADAAGAITERTVWPIGLAFFEQTRILIAWCELRADFRSFRADRMRGITLLSERYPKRRRTLMAEWKRNEGIGS
jgi:predicted DNA-binding transcriptional regulator YafY